MGRENCINDLTFNLLLDVEDGEANIKIMGIIMMGKDVGVLCALERSGILVSVYLVHILFSSTLTVHPYLGGGTDGHLSRESVHGPALVRGVSIRKI